MDSREMKRDLVQILVATYNGEKFISEQLDSLLNQTYDCVEILCRDDGSDDKTCEILNDYEIQYSNKLKVIKDNIKTGCACGNFMLLLKNAEAPYVMFCDQDDYWFPDKVEETLRLMKEEEGQSNELPLLIYSDYIVADENLTPVKTIMKNNQIYKGYKDLSHLLVQNYVTGCTIMVNKSLYKNSISDSSNILMHDWWMALCAASSGRILYVRKPLMYYRQHGDNVVGAVNIRSFKYILSKIFDPKLKESMNAYVKQANTLLEEYPFIDQYSEKIIQDFIDISCHNKMERCMKLIKGNYLKSTIPRVLGQLWYI